MQSESQFSTDIPVNGDHVTIRTPKVHTLQVTVRTLRIGTKQVTQSVFRQLPQRSVWDPMTGTLLGQPWGTVNYFWGDCSAGNHLHVVWQQGERLFRDCVYDPQRRLPVGIAEAIQRVRAQEELLTHAAQYVCTLGVWQRGWDLTPRQAPTFASVPWPCGINTRFTIPARSHGEETLRDRIAVIGHMRTAEALRHREYLYEECLQTARPEGEDWRESPGFAPPKWSRQRKETEAEWEARTRTAFTEAFAQLEQELQRGALAWDLAQVPGHTDDAKHQLNHVAQAWLTATAHEKHLREQFAQTYEHCLALDQLFIAV